MSPEYDYLFKLLLIGDSGVGKSCLLLRFADDTYTQSYISTIGVDFKIRTIELEGKTVKLQIWDTAGQERYRSVTRSYYRGAAGALIVYDITNRDSYNHLINWLADARTLARADISIITVGNKVDQKDKRAVTFLEASRCAQENDILFLETSALTGEGVEEVFIKVARMILNKIEDGLIDPNTMVSGIHTGSQRIGSDGSGELAASKACSC